METTALAVDHHAQNPTHITTQQGDHHIGHGTQIPTQLPTPTHAQTLHQKPRTRAPERKAPPKHPTTHELSITNQELPITNHNPKYDTLVVVQIMTKPLHTSTPVLDSLFSYPMPPKPANQARIQINPSPNDNLSMHRSS